MSFRFEIFSSVEYVDRNLWNRLAESAVPTMEWEYFHSLEKSGSVSMSRGYRPAHIVALDGEEPVAIAPFYERDRAWVEFGDSGLLEFLTEVTGVPYHHGLVGMIPFTPVPGYQFLYGPDADPERTAKAVLDYVDFQCATRDLPTSRIYFISPAASHLHGLLERQGYFGLKSQYCLWVNKGYRDFDDFLAGFKSGRRTKIKRELREIRENGIDISMVPASDMAPSCYDEMYDLYVSTWTRHMGPDVAPFLNRSFFRILSESCRHRNLFSVARRKTEILAMAIFYHKAGNLYGRYWGCHEEVPFLHFATCYYNPIDYAIRRGISAVDPGFGGEHKLYRGFETVPAYHYIKFHDERQRRLAMTIIDKIKSQLGV